MGLLFNLLSFGNDEEKKLCLSFSILFLFLLKILLEKPKKEGTKGFAGNKKQMEGSTSNSQRKKVHRAFLLTFRFQFSPNKGRSKGNSRSRLDNRRKQHFFVGFIIKAFFFILSKFYKRVTLHFEI